MTAALSQLGRATLTVVVILVIWSVPVQAGNAKGLKIEGLVVFGDSLSDTTNLNALTAGLLPATSPPYFDGRFSNGPLWVETLAPFLGVDVDFETNVAQDPLASMQAFGGALTDTRNANAVISPEVAGTGILGQVADFENAGGRIQRRELVIVWGGANDYFVDVDPSPVMIVNNLRRAVEDLAALGGRVFLVPNLPDLGDTPLALDLGVQGPLNALVAQHNKLLAVAMARLARRLRIKIILLDVNAAFTGLEGLFGNLIIPCIIQDPPFDPFVTGICPLKPDGVPDSTANGGSLYMDVIHPTTEAHRLLGAFAFGAITEAARKPMRRRRHR